MYTYHTEGVPTRFDPYANLIKHPKHCPRCQRIWEIESQVRHECIYCGECLPTKEKESLLWKLIKSSRNLLPYVLYLIAAIQIMKWIGIDYG